MLFIAGIRNCVERSLPWWNSYVVIFIHDPVVFPGLSEISDLVSDFAWQHKQNFWPLRKSDLFLNQYVSCFASQSKGINFGNEVFDVRCENKNFWLDVR